MSKFSIIIATHNNEDYIEEAINSVLDQTFIDWELIIVNDKSTDKTKKKIKPFLQDNRIKLINNKKQLGVGASRNIGVKNISSKFFGDLDGDDKLFPNAIAIMYQAHLDNPKAGMIYSQFMHCDINMNPIRLGYCKNIPIGKTNLEADKVSHFRTYKLKYFNKTTGFHEIISKAIDKDISFKMEEVSELKFINEILYFYRNHSKGISQYKGNEAWKCAEQVRKEARERRGIINGTSN